MGTCQWARSAQQVSDGWWGMQLEWRERSGVERSQERGQRTMPME